MPCKEAATLPTAAQDRLMPSLRRELGAGRGCVGASESPVGEVLLERFDLVGVLEVFLVGDLAPARTCEQHGAVVVHDSPGGRFCLGAEDHADQGSPRRTIDQNLVRLPDDSVGQEPAQELLDRGLTAVLPGPFALAREDQYSVLGVASQERLRVTVGKFPNVATDHLAN